MGKSFNRTLPLLALCSPIAATACGNFFVSESAVNSVTVSPSAIVVTVGETMNLTAFSTTVGGSESDDTSAATWSSSNTVYATVDAGTVTGVAACKPKSSNCATISATLSDVTGTARVIVTDGTLPTSLTLTGTTAVAVGSTTQFHAYAVLNGTTTDISSYVNWSSEDTAYATVSSAGLVTGVKSCSASLLSVSCPTITATITTSDGTITGTRELVSVD